MDSKRRKHYGISCDFSSTCIYRAGTGFRIRIVPQANVYVVERLGAFYKAWGTGIHFLVPFIDRVAKRVSIKEQVVDFKPRQLSQG